MASTLEVTLLIAATIANGLLAGASLDKVLVQLPARRTIGLAAMAAYNRATDLGPGLVLYPTLGLGAPALTFAAAIILYLGGNVSGGVAAWVGIGAVLSIGHIGTTTRAAPNLLRLQRGTLSDDELEGLYRRFARWSAARSMLQIATFVAVTTALAAAV